MTFSIEQLRDDLELQRNNVQQALDMWESSALALTQGLVKKHFPDATGITYETQGLDQGFPEGFGSVELTGVLFDNNTQRLSGVQVEELEEDIANEAILYELLERCPEYRDITELEFE